MCVECLKKLDLKKSKMVQCMQIGSLWQEIAIEEAANHARERNERERELEEMGEGERERESSWLGAHRARPWAAARACKWPRPVPSCLKSAQRQPSGPDTYTWPSRCGVRSTRTAQRPAKVAHPLAPGVSGASAWAPAADAPALPRPCAPPTHSLKSLCPRASL